jgi:2-polyprenyl-3-methyl-5-hydroxy-6-metoxy-1,4-benzoquinol methylase
MKRRFKTSIPCQEGESISLMDDDAEISFNDHSINFFCKYARGKTVLDLGCVNHNPLNYRSKYWVHKALCTVASDCVGMDICEDGINYLKEKGYNVFVGNAEDFNIDRKFDVIVAGDLMEHLGNVSKFIECSKSHLKPSGFLLLSTPNPWHWRFIIKGLFSCDVKPNREHTCWFCLPTITQLLSRHNMVIKEIKYGSRYWPDRSLPLPSLIKHTTMNVAATLSHKTFYTSE